MDKSKAKVHYAAIIGRDIMAQVGFMLDFKNQQVHWDDITIPMRLHHPTKSEEVYANNDRLIAANYTAANLKSCLPEHLRPHEQQKLLALLTQFESLFQGKLGCMSGPPLDIELKPNVTPIHARPYPIPRAHLELVKEEIKRMKKLGIIRQIFDTPWAAPSFAIPKKTGGIRVVTDFRGLNQHVVRHPFPLPRISDIFNHIDGFTYATSLDLNMGFYHIRMSQAAQRICTTILPWGKYAYERLPMGLSISPDVFQHRMTTILGDLPYVIIYIDDVLIITRGTIDDHLTALSSVFQCLQDNDLQVNTDKSKFFALELSYLGFILSQQGIKPDPKKIQAIQDLQSPSSVKDL